jgi:long-chain fatty acid transport protein
MKKIILLSAMASSMLLATNGDNLISLGAESRAMGGTGIAMPMGTDSVFKNPSWLAEVKGPEAMFGATLFMPDVTLKNEGTGNGEAASSQSDMSLIPAVAHADRIDENWAYGVGMFGVSGMGTDYRGESPMKGLGEMRTNFQYMRFVPSIAYKQDNLRVGVGLTLAYGALDIAAITPDHTGANLAPRGGGTSDDFGFGAQFGIGYTPTANINLGAFYQSEVATEYENVYNFNTANDMTMADGSSYATYENLKLSQPAEYGVGVGYHDDKLRVSADVKQVLWSSADGYEQFGWDDQTVYSLGLGYSVSPEVELRGGYSYAKSPLGDADFPAATVGGAPMPGANIAVFNIMGFPAISEQHITAGVGYQFNKKIGLDFAYVYSPEETLSKYGFTTTNEQNSISGALKYKF